MIVAIIGGRSVNTVQDVIKKNFDNLDVHTYKSISEFTNEMSVRSLDVDRMIIMQDGIAQEQNLESLLKAFFEYLAKYYPALRLVSLAKDVNITHTIASIFVSPLCTHIVSDSVKPRMLLDMVSKDIPVIQEEYGYKEIKIGVSDTVEVVGEEEDAPEVVENVSDTNVAKPVKKKKGLFNLFGKKNKEQKERRAVGQVVLDQEVEEKPHQEVTLPEVDTNDTIVPLAPSVSLEKEEVVNEPESERVLKEDELDFSVFGIDSTDILQPEEDKFDGISLENINFNSSKNNVDINQDITPDNSEKFNISLAKDEKIDGVGINLAKDDAFEGISSVEENKIISEDVIGENQDIPNGVGFEPILDIEENNVGVVEEAPFDININIDDKKKKIEDLMSVTQKGVDTDLSDVQVPFKQKDITFNLEDVEDVNLGIDNLDTLQDEYQEKTAPVVEKVVERVVKVSTNLNKNGVSYIILTGDRRNGTTRNALELASLYAKKNSVLYVDFDIDRHGSLAYLDIGDILDCQDIVQNGLGMFNKVTQLEKLTYRDMKHGFDCLLSVYGADLTDADIDRVSKLLAAQRAYSVVIIDCPLDKLNNVSSLFSFSNILLCTENNYISLLNTITSIVDSAKLSEDSLLCLFNNSSYLITKNCLNPQEFKNNMEYLDILFDFEHSEFNWTTIEVGATSKNLAAYVNRN